MISKDLCYLFVISILMLQISCISSAQQQIYEQVKAERKPFQKSSYVINQPKEPSKEELKTEGISDPKSRVVVVDEKAGKYEFRWIGTDGKEKIVAYQRHDAIDAIVDSKIERTQNNKILYKYVFKVLPTSSTYFTMFIVQTIASDAKPVETEDYLLPYPNIKTNYKFMITQMSNVNPMFKIGSWWMFGFVGKEKERIYGGKNIEFQLTSTSIPGIVNCKAIGGELGTKGVGEEIPSHLENQIPIFQDLAWGYTIGPVESLSNLSKAERAKYLLDNLPKFQEAGWMSEGTAKNYESILKKEDLNGAFEKAKKDLESEFITNEVFQIIEGLNQ